MSLVKTLAGFALLAISCLVIFGHTLDIPWFLDDLPGIVENPLVRSVPASLADIFQPRGLTTLSFALNYHFGQFELSGYHLINILLHLVVSGLIFLLLKAVCSFTHWIALGGALLFLTHPVQTQAVNYVVQRSTLLAALFVLLSILCFFSAEKRLAAGGGVARSRNYWLLWGLALIFGAWAVLTKQNAATLPLLLLILGQYRQTVSWRLRLKRILPFCVAPAAVLFYMVIFPLLAGEELARVASTRQLSNLDGMTPFHYFVTELSVLPLYLKLLFFPVGLRLDYAYPLATRLFSIGNILLFSGHLLVLACAFRYRNRFRALSFAAFWFYAALLVESSFIPLDPVFEHRLYLPIIGPIVLFCSLFQKTLERTRYAVFGFVLLLLTLGFLSWQRNELWRQPVAFAEDNARRSSHAEGPWVALSGRYLEAGRLVDARQALERARVINPAYTRIYINLSSVSLQEGKHVAAQSEALAGLKFEPRNEKLQKNLAISYLQAGDLSRGVALLEGLARLQPEDYSLRVLLAQTAINQKNWSVAASWLQGAVAIGTGQDYLPHYLLGIVYYEQQKLSAAEDSLRYAAQLNGQDVATLRGLGFILVELGDLPGARRQLQQLEKLDKRAAESLQGAIRAATLPRGGSDSD